MIRPAKTTLILAMTALVLIVSLIVLVATTYMIRSVELPQIAIPTRF
ncbi:hypothetical protein [Spirosoma harenae]